MPAKLNLIGQKFGRLTVISEAPRSKNRLSRWDCLCSCGARVSVLTSSLRSGETKSCGCLKKELVAKKNRQNSTHGDSKTRIYRIWAGVKSRCTNPNTHEFPRYGGRGIFVCSEWLHDFTAFKTWALASGYQDNLTIDRINNDLGYSPDNCRWVTMAEQNRNHRNTRRYQGELLSVWCKRLGMNLNTVATRLNLGWEMERALFTPVRERKRKGQ